MREYTIDLKHKDLRPEYISKMIWQELFKVYRELGDLDDINSFLCDLETICRRVYYANNYQRVITMNWFVSKNYTNLADISGGEESVVFSYDPNQMFIHFKVLK